MLKDNGTTSVNGFTGSAALLIKCACISISYTKLMRKSMLINHDNSVCHPVMILWIAPLLSAWYVWNYTAIVWLRIELCKGDGCSHQLVFASLKVKQTENQATLWIGLINTYQPTRLSGVFHHAWKSIVCYANCGIDIILNCFLVWNRQVSECVCVWMCQ